MGTIVHMLDSISKKATTITDRFRAVAREWKGVRSVESFEAGLLSCPKCNTKFKLADAVPLSLTHCPKCNDLLFFPMKLLNVWLVEPLGAGGFGSVYLGRLAEQPKQRVAMKLLRISTAPDETVAMFEAECRLISSIPHHPNIPEVHEHGTIDDFAYLAMEYLDGSRLEHLVESRGRLAEEESLFYTLDVLDALEHVLHAGYVHRDVKPQNVIVTSSNVAKLIDMGSCMTVEESSASTSSSIVGTPLFLPPERCLRKGEDHRADIYALGLLLYFMTMGTNYIESNDVTDIVLKHAVKLKVPIATRMHGHDPDLSTLIQWMTRRDPDERPQTYDELRHAVIQRIVNHMTRPAANSRIADRRKQLRKMYRIAV